MLLIYPQTLFILNLKGHFLRNRFFSPFASISNTCIAITTDFDNLSNFQFLLQICIKTFTFYKAAEELLHLRIFDQCVVKIFHWKTRQKDNITAEADRTCHSHLGYGTTFDCSVKQRFAIVMEWIVLNSWRMDRSLWWMSAAPLVPVSPNYVSTCTIQTYHPIFLHSRFYPLPPCPLLQSLISYRHIFPIISFFSPSNPP